MYYIEPSFTTKQINKALKENRDITFKSGRYRLTDCLILYSNTKVTCEGWVAFCREHKGRMLQLNVSPETTAYSGTHDIIWKGGIFHADYRNENANVVSLFHGKNITLQDIQIQGCRGYHSIEINACRNVLVEDCVIFDQSSKEGETFREAIQIDFANKDGLATKNAKGTSPCYDGTHCQDITIKNSIIRNCPNGFGTHTVSVDLEYHKNIKLLNVEFLDIQGYAIQLFGVDGFFANTSVEIKSHIGIKTQAHLNSGGKTKLAVERGNKNVKLRCGETETVID